VRGAAIAAAVAVAAAAALGGSARADVGDTTATIAAHSVSNPACNTSLVSPPPRSP